MPITGYTTCKTFSVSHHEDREQLGATVTAWIAANDQLEVVAQKVLQSSDTRRHCITVVLFLRQRVAE